MKVLLTSTSFQDTPGQHQVELENTGWEIIRMRGPLKEEKLLEIIDDVDLVICGDDEYTEKVLEKGKKARLKGLSKYGVGLDSIDLETAKRLNIPVTNCPGVNQNAVAEHVFGLLLTFFRNIHSQNETVQQYSWKRLVGTEVSDKVLGVFGLGSVGKEVVKKAKAWGMDVYVLDKYIDQDFVDKYEVNTVDSIKELVSKVDVLSLHSPLTIETENIISKDLISNSVKPGITIINTARGRLVDNDAILEGINNGIIKGYLADVLEEEPITNPHPFIGEKQILITPHVGSRTFESVQKQGLFAISNAKKILNA